MRKAVIIIILAAAVFFAGYKIMAKINQRRALAEGTGRSGGNRFQSILPVVQAKPLVPEPIAEVLRLAGEIEAENEIAIQPRLSGRLTELLADQGQTVRAGQLLAVLDDETIRLQMQQSEAGMLTIQANLRQAELNAARAKADLERYKELLANRYISQKEYDTAEAACLNAQANVEGLNAQLAAARKNYEILGAQLGYTKIYSPAAGIVLAREATVGMNLTTGTTIMTIAPVNPVRLAMSLDQKDSSRVRRGMKARFSCDAFPGQIFVGTINEVAPSFDPKTRALTLGARLNNPGGKLLPGIFGTAEIEIGRKEKALVVPEEAVVTRDGRRGVFVVNQGRVVEFTAVTTGLSSEGRIEITGGVRPGALVVVIGQNRLRDGQEVQMMGGGPRERPDPGINGRPGRPQGNGPGTGANRANRRAGESR